MRTVRSPVRWLVGPPPEAVGKEPDPRFSYANERTFLAWNRTALALISVGLAVTNLLPPFHLPFGRRIIGLPLIGLGAFVALASLREWAGNQRAMFEPGTVTAESFTAFAGFLGEFFHYAGPHTPRAPENPDATMFTCVN